MVLVDTSIWSLAFRRRQPNEELPEEATSLQELIRSDRDVGVPGVVLQELLSGLREKAQFNRLSRLMIGFSIVLATEEDHVRAAKISNICRKNGVAAKTVDCLIAAMTLERNAQLFTVDNDFNHISELASLKLYGF